jgi:hypothetical protein
MPKRPLKIFVGYQISSKYHTNDEIRNFFQAKLAKSLDDQLKVDLSVKFGDKFDTGNLLIKEVSKAISECDIAIFDISENNPNVMTEVGMAYGENKHTILLKCDQSNKKYKVPSDYSGVIYIPYKKFKNLLNDLVRAIEKYLANWVPNEFYFKQIWNFGVTDKIIIICPTLPDGERNQRPEDKEFLYLAKYGDIDSFLLIYTSLTKLFPYATIQHFTAEEFMSSYDNLLSENLVLIGGPDYNSVTEYFVDHKPICQFSYLELESNGEVVIKCTKTGKEYRSSFDGGGQVNCIDDYGFFAKAVNPLNKHKLLFMIGGLHTYGVLGATKTFSFANGSETKISKLNSETVFNIVGNQQSFSAIIKTSCVNEKVATPSVSPEDISTN